MSKEMCAIEIVIPMAGVHGMPSHKVKGSMTGSRELSCHRSADPRPLHSTAWKISLPKKKREERKKVEF